MGKRLVSDCALLGMVGTSEDFSGIVHQKLNESLQTSRSEVEAKKDTPYPTKSPVVV